MVFNQTLHVRTLFDYYYPGVLLPDALHVPDATDPMDLKVPMAAKNAVVVAAAAVPAVESAWYPSVASFVLAVLSPFTCLTTAIPAIILGIVSLVKIERSAGRLKGLGFAIAGIAVPPVLLPLMMGILIL